MKRLKKMHDTPVHPAERLAVLSDAHLGHPGARAAGIDAASLRPLWQGVDRLVLNGDSAELQIPACRTAAFSELAELARLTEQDGVRLLYLSGNHDAMITDRRHLVLGEGKVLITHGDLLHPTIAPWSREAHNTRRLIESQLAEFGARHDREPDLRELLAIYQHAGHAAFLDPAVQRHASGLRHLLLRPHRWWSVLHYWLAMPSRAAGVLEKYLPGAEVIVLGHAHHHGVWHRRGRTVINTGSFRFPGRPRVVRIAGPELTVHRIERVEGCFVAEDEPIYTHRLGRLPQEHEHAAPQEQPVFTPMGVPVLGEAA